MKIATLASVFVAALLVAGAAATFAHGSDGRSTTSSTCFTETEFHHSSSSSTSSSSHSSSSSTSSTSSGSGSASSSTTTCSHGEDREEQRLACKGLTVGETLTVTGLTGHYQDTANHASRGDASGSLSLQVSSIYASGCVLSITRGTLTLATANTITGGTIVLNSGGHSGNGWGTTSSGSFLIQTSGMRGNSASATLGAVGLDLKTGTSEFLVYLHS